MITIVKVGGKVVEDEQSLNNLLDGFTSITGKKLLVHGGGRSATKLSEKLGIEAKMVEGRRITDAATLEIVTMVYAGKVNKNIVAQLQKRGVNALGLTGADMNTILSVKRPVKDVDYGFVGDVESVQIDVLSSLINDDVVPVMSPITHDGNGQLLNTNADTIASELGRALSNIEPVTLKFCFDLPGVMLDQNDPKSLIRAMSREEFQDYKEQGVIKDGMIPKLENGFKALEKGVKFVVITNPDGLKTGVGTTLIN